jgi:hypothetical protein
MAVLSIDFKAAAAWLSDVDEAPAPEPVVKVRYAPVGVRKRFEMPDGVERGPLKSWNSVARDYVLSRGITAEQVATWDIGYSLMGRLAGRIVFPIVDSSGRLANYAARTFVNDETRYLAADELEGPELAAMLGERFWPVITRSARTVVCFEGAVSGLALERAMRRAGLSAELAGLQGSDVANPRRAARLATFGRVVCATDPDAAGERAYEEIVAMVGGKTEVVRLRYPSERDAADTPEADLASALAKSFAV